MYVTTITSSVIVVFDALEKNVTGIAEVTKVGLLWTRHLKENLTTEAE